MMPAFTLLSRHTYCGARAMFAQVRRAQEADRHVPLLQNAHVVCERRRGQEFAPHSRTRCTGTSFGRKAMYTASIAVARLPAAYFLNQLFAKDVIKGHWPYRSSSTFQPRLPGAIWDTNCSRAQGSTHQPYPLPPPAPKHTWQLKAFCHAVF
jgi:hypothetical protein